MTEKVLLVDPAETVTLVGTVAAATVSLKLTITPPDGAGPVNVTLPVDTSQEPTMVEGLMVTSLSAAGKTVREAVFVTPFAEAEMVAVVLLATTFAETAKVAVVAPAATVTLPGTVAVAVLLDKRVTTVPPDGAGLPKVTVPVADLPPVTLVGLRISDDKPVDDELDVIFSAMAPKSAL